MLVNEDLWLIGDPHFGIEFNKRGTPLARRGDREAMQLAQFKEELNYGSRYNVMVGDLFDKPLVELKLVHQIYEAYKEAAEARPEVTFILLAGNHDLFRQLVDPRTGEKLKGSFHALEIMLLHIPNVIVIREPTVIANMVLFPWQWGVSASEQVSEFKTLPEIAIGHWDLVDFGGDDSHMCPVSSLRDLGVKEIYSGHIHTAGDYGGVTCTGSMQPYTHAEDPEGSMYVTLTLEELDLIDHDDLKDMNVRVLLKPGEALPEIDCLSLNAKRVDDSGPVEVAEVGFGSFDLKATMFRNMEDLKVPENIRSEVWEKINVAD